MALLGWFMGFACLLGGLALRQDMPVGGSSTLSNLLFAIAILACPMIWQGGTLGISRGQRIAAGLALLFALPLVLMPAA
ncbi:MAG: hypothetical protein ABW039_00820 [Sphingobium sp.]